MIGLLAPFAQRFSARVWVHAQGLVLGAILAPGKRTVSSCLWVRGLAWERHCTPYPRVVTRAPWSALPASKILLGVMSLLRVPPGAAIVLGADATVERRSGRQIKAKGCYRDAVRSSKTHVVRCVGLQGGARRLLVPGPWASRGWALPFLPALCWPAPAPHQRRHKTSGDGVRQMTTQGHRGLPERLLGLGVAGGFAPVALALACGDSQVGRVARLRLEAALYPPPAPQPQGKRGRKPTQGPRHRRLQGWAARADTPWEELEVDW